MVAYAFNAQQYEPRYGGSGGLPAGDFVGVISKTEPTPTKDGQGSFLAVELKVTEGPQTGGTHVDRLNLYNTNPDTVRIANGQLSAYCHVLGKFSFADTNELCGVPFRFRIGPQKNGEYTEVKAIFDINGNEPGKAGSGQQAQQQQPQGAAPAGFGAQGPANGGAGWGQGGGAPQQAGPGPQGGQQGAGWGQPGQGQPDPNQGQPQGGWSGGGQQQQPQQQQPAQGGWNQQQQSAQGGAAPGWGAR